MIIIAIINCQRVFNKGSFHHAKKSESDERERINHFLVNVGTSFQDLSIGEKKFEWKKKNVILDKANVSISEQRHPRLLFPESIL